MELPFGRDDDDPHDVPRIEPERPPREWFLDDDDVGFRDQEDYRDVFQDPDEGDRD